MFYKYLALGCEYIPINYIHININNFHTYDIQEIYVTDDWHKSYVLNMIDNKAKKYWDLDS